MNSYMRILYNGVKGAILDHHPKDEVLVGIIAEMFLDVDKEIVIRSIHSSEFTTKGDNDE